MRSRLFVGSLLIIGALGFGAARVATAPAVKWAAVNLQQTVVIAGAFVTGPVVFVHDDARMARGEPCTTVHRYTDKGLGEQIVAFHCKPRWGKKAPAAFTQNTTTKPDGPPVLTEYQFAGDDEAHEVPIR